MHAFSVIHAINKEARDGFTEKMPYPSQAKMKFLTHRAGEAPLVVRNQQQLSWKENHWRDGRNLAEGTKAGTQDRYRAEPLQASLSRMQRNGWMLTASHAPLRGPHSTSHRTSWRRPDSFHHTSARGELGAISRGIGARSPVHN